jgi:hypothetical protein
MQNDMFNPFDAPIPGEAWQHKPGSMAYDRPPKYAGLDEALNNAFDKLRRPKVTKRMLNLLEVGMPIDKLIVVWLTKEFGDGTYGAPVLMQMVAPMTVMMWRMAEAAGIEPTTSDDKRHRSEPDFDPSDMLAAKSRFDGAKTERADRANTISREELSVPNLADQQGFLKFRPKPRGK